MVGLFITGLLSGIISGMGIGGGTVLIPILSIFFNMPQKQVQSINLIYFLPTAAVALYTHIKNKRVEKEHLKGLVFAGLAGAAIGSVVALGLSNQMLRPMFGWFLMVMGIREIYVGIKKGRQ